MQHYIQYHIQHILYHNMLCHIILQHVLSHCEGHRILKEEDIKVQPEDVNAEVQVDLIYMNK